jgi:hypothetical protein
MDLVKELTNKLLPFTSEIKAHGVYSKITSIAHIRKFMEQHVFAVWDFMCLLKELQRKIVSTSAPWFPPKDGLSANLINSILVEEEGDLTEDGAHYASHFEIYIQAMEKIGANTVYIEKLLNSLKDGINLEEAMILLPIRKGTKDFVLTTFSFFGLEAHELAAVFVYGREGITSSLFLPLLEQLKNTAFHADNNKLSTLIYYFKRHVELDDGEHFPRAIKMLANLIANDQHKYNEAEKAAVKALTARINFLTDIEESFLES